jgi:hypothetical protein
MPCPYMIIWGRETALPCPPLLDNQETAMPCPYMMI